MRRCCWIVTLLIATPVIAQNADPWLVVPGKSVGPITAQTLPAELPRLFGTGNVKEEMVGPGGDAEAELATMVNSKSPETSLVIFWDKLDKTGRHPDVTAHPSFVNLCYASNPRAKGCKWHLADGITAGTSLRELEALNGRDFDLAGFGWDYEGTVMDWKDGKLNGLSKSCGGGVGLALRPDEQVDVPGSDVAKSYEKVLGDHKFSSSLPAMQQLDPVIFSMNVKFEAAGNCPAH